MKLNKRCSLKALIYFILQGLILIACVDKSHIQDNLKSTETTIAEDRKKPWIKVSSNIWQSDDGRLGLQVKTFSPKNLDFTLSYLEYVFVDEEIYQLNDIIDIDSFQNVQQSTFYKDKNHIYRLNPMYGGGTFSVLEKVDVSSFELLNYCFARDKNHIIHWKDEHYNHNYDHDTFQTCPNCGCVARDKAYFYVLGKKLNRTQINEKIKNPNLDKNIRSALEILLDPN